MNIVPLLDDSCLIYNRDYILNALNVLNLRQIRRIARYRPAAVQNIQIRRRKLDITSD